MRAFAIAGRRVVPAATAGAAVTANQPSASARECVQVAEHSHHAPRKLQLDEDWLVTDFGENQEMLVFKPFTPAEVDTAFKEVSQLVMPRPNILIEDLDAGRSAGGCASPTRSEASSTSQGEDANLVIEQTSLRMGNSSSSSGGGGGAWGVFTPSLDAGGQQQMSTLLRITNRLLQSPGLQREVVKCMLEDDEVRELMLRESRDMDAYLAAAGIHAPGLLPAPEGAADADDNDAASAAEQQQEGLGAVLSTILSAVAVVVDKAGSALQGMGGWFRDRWQQLGDVLAASLGSDQEEQAASGKLGEEEEEECAQGTGRKPQQRGWGRAGRTRGRDVVMTTVMIVAVAVMCSLLARRPVLRVLRRV